ncbi:DegV family protein [Salibacterium salarium]|uniref:DegV family protein n=1 Tax=Salibacterium salarium TaxID=284579 RepID=A0A3R9QGE3_9BACI|nr:DegV family protein [Salibacterium salarium]RSL29949.1 DegV family protein [Salibacterium salarium]
MSRIAIVTDSTAYLPSEAVEQSGITVVPLSVIFGETSYREDVDISTASFYEKLQATADLPTTSQPALGRFIEVFEELSKEYESIISIHLSSGISGTYQTARTAAEEVDNVDVYAFDSEITCMPQGYYVLEAAKMASASETVDTILERLEEMKRSTRAYFVADDLSHLHRGGRLNGAQAFVGSLLQIKPILHFENKRIVPFEKVRTKKKALNRVFELFAEDAATGAVIRATVIHANRPEKADTMRKELADTYPNADIDVSYFGPVVGTHLGEGGLGIGWCKL